MSNQAEIADETIKLLVESELFDSVELIGSVAKGEYDELSDIDILVSCLLRSPKENVELACAVIENEYGSSLKGWSLSLLPEKYLISLFLPKTSIFWWLDIGCLPSPNFEPLYRDDISQDLNIHIAKLWVMNAKHMLRNTEPRLRIRELYAKVFGVKVEFPGEALAFKKIFYSIDFTNINTEFHSGCLQVMQNIKLHFIKVCK